MAEPSDEAILASYLAQRATAEGAALRLSADRSDPIALMRDIRIDVSIDGNRVGARAIHLPTGIAVEAPGLGVALSKALQECIAAVTGAGQSGGRPSPGLAAVCARWKGCDEH